MSESFAQMFEESMADQRMQPGSIVIGTVLEIQDELVSVYAGLKSEANIPRWQFLSEKGELEINIGDQVELALETVEDGFGETRLSRDKAKRFKTWIELDQALTDNATVHGMISGKVKGGFTVDIKNVRAFLPGSLVDIRPVRDSSYLENKELEFKVIKLDRKRNNVVVSRRAVVEAEYSADRQALLDNLQEGSVVKGIVKNLTDYGAFIDLGGVDGLLHITDMAWRRVTDPAEFINVGDEIEVKVLKFDRERSRVSLGLKQMEDDPWSDLSSRYPVNKQLSGKVANITDYGAFVELEPGVEGLVHVSELDWTNKNIHPSKVVQLGDEVEIVVLDIDEERRRISLSMKKCHLNPWEQFAAINNKGDKIEGKIKSITDFGVFIGLDGGIDGLVHLSDISWNDEGMESIRKYSKGQEIETVVLSVDPERERISLGIKQLDKDPFAAFVAEHPKGSLVEGVVIEVESKGATVKLASGVEGYIRVAEIARERTDDSRTVLKEGDEIKAKFMAVDKKNRMISLSVRSKDMDEEAEVMKSYRDAEPQAAQTVGDLLKEQMNKSSD